jgi:hypothetical protein
VSDQVELLVIEPIELADGGATVAVRCHAGTLRIGDELTIGIDPERSFTPDQLAVRRDQAPTVAFG